MRVYWTYFLIMFLIMLIKVFGDFLIVGTRLAIVLLNCTFILAINVIYFPLSCAHFTLKFVCVQPSHLLNSLYSANNLLQCHCVMRHEHGVRVSNHHLPNPSDCLPGYIRVETSASQSEVLSCGGDLCPEGPHDDQVTSNPCARNFARAHS